MRKKIDFKYWYDIRFRIKKKRDELNEYVNYDFYLIPAVHIDVEVYNPTKYDQSTTYLLGIRWLHLRFWVGFCLRNKFTNEK